MEKKKQKIFILPLSDKYTVDSESDFTIKKRGGINVIK